MFQKKFLTGLTATVVTLFLFVFVVSLVEGQGGNRHSTTESTSSLLAPVDTTFTYQGELQISGTPTTGDYGFEFRLYDGAVAGIQVGPTQAMTVTVTDGLFTVLLDFGTVFDGTALWLDMTVDGTPLTPRQPLTGAPYAHYALDGPDADPSNEYNTGISFDGSTLTVTDGGGNQSIDISALENDADPDPTNEYNISMNLVGTNLVVSDGGGIVSADLASLRDGVDDADNNPANEYNTAIGLSGTTLSITDGGGTLSQDLSGIAGGDNDWAYSSGSDLTGALYRAGSVTVTNGQSFWTLGPNGNANAQLYENGANNGVLSLYNSAGNSRLDAFVDGTTNAGGLFTYGPSSTNVVLGNLDGYNNNGFIGVVDNTDTIWAYMYIDAAGYGIVTGDIKAFHMTHPLNPKKEIWYASVEGPEVAAYTRGTAQLVNGLAHIDFPEHFSLVVNPETMTTILTPRSADSKGLAVVAQDAQGITVQELGDGAGNYAFDWEVKGVRQGYEGFEVVREKQPLVNMTPVQSSSTPPTVPTSQVSATTEIAMSAHEEVLWQQLQAENETLRAQNEQLLERIEAIEAFVGMEEAQKQSSLPLGAMGLVLLSLVGFVFVQRRTKEVNIS